MEQKDQFILLTPEEFPEWLNAQTISRKITMIQEHHTYIPDYSHFDGKNHFERLEAIDNYHEDVLGWRDSGQHFVTFPDGIIGVCRTLEWNPGGIYGWNEGAISIENLGNFDIGHDEMTVEQRQTIILLTALLSIKFEIKPNKDNIVYHHWFDLDTGKRTDGLYGNLISCPGSNFFGGNKVEDFEENFLPLVKSRIIEEQYVIEDIFEQRKITADVLNVRTLPSIKGIDIGDYYKDDVVNINGKVSNGWYRVIYNNQVAYIHGGYTRPYKTFEDSKINDEAYDKLLIKYQSLESDYDNLLSDFDLCNKQLKDTSQELKKFKKLNEHPIRKIADLLIKLINKKGE